MEDARLDSFCSGAKEARRGTVRTIAATSRSVGAAAFVGSSHLYSKQYHERRSRTGNLCELLGKLRLPDRVGPDDDPEPA
jgi:hypothetical protein